VEKDPAASFGKNSCARPIIQHTACGKRADIRQRSELIVGGADLDSGGMNLAGSVKVEIVIGPDGRVKGTNVVGGHPILVDATLVALKEWKYEPAKTETNFTLTFDFRP